MELVKQLHSDGVHVYNVNEKVPADYSGDIPRYYSKDELSSRQTNINFDIPRVGMRVGQQKSEYDFIICLDFDCYDGNSNFNQEVSSKCQELRELTNEEGFYSTSTDGNYQCLINIGMCPSLISKIKSLGKQKVELFKKEGLVKNSTALELILFDWNVCLPPTRTINKRNKQIGEERKWLTDKSYFVLGKTSRVYDWLNELIPEPPTRCNSIVESKEDINVELVDAEESKEGESTQPSGEVIDLIQALPPKYLMDRDLWIRIGMIMKNEGYEVRDWADISRSVDGFQNEPDSTYETQWRSFRNDKSLTKASLWYWLKEEDEAKFKELKDKYSQLKPKTLLNQLTELDLAHTLIQRYKDMFIAIPSVTPTKPPIVYRYDGDIWKKSDAYDFIMSLIGILGKELIQDYKHEIFIIMKQIDDAKEGLDELESRKKNLQKLQTSAVNLTHKTTSRKHIREEFITLLPKYDEQIFNLDLDSLHFKNGKLCLKTGQLLPRCKEDYVTKIIPYDYQEQMDKDKIKWLHEIISRIQPESNELQGTLDWLGYCITGHTNHHYIKINTGRGNNGKSLIHDLMQNALPIYCLKMENETFSKATRDSAKSLIRLLEDPIRYAYLEEIDEKEMDTKALKTFTDQRLSIKPIYQNQITGNHTAKLNINTNIEPRFKSDGGILRRIRIQEHNTIFLKKHEERTGRRHEYYEDPTLTLKFKQDDSLKCAFIHLLLPHAQKFYKQGLTLPASWEETAEQVGQANNPWADWKDNFYHTGLQKDKISKQDILDLVKSIKPQATWMDARQALKECDLIKDFCRNTRVQGEVGRGALIGYVLTNPNFYGDELSNVESP